MGRETDGVLTENALAGEVEQELETPKTPATEPFYPHHLIRQVVQVLLVFGLLATLATLWPAPMGTLADPTQMPGQVTPEWVFLAAHHLLEMVKLLPVAPLLQQTIGVSLVVVGFLVILLVPYIDRREERRPRKRPVALVLLALAIVAYVALTLWPQLVEFLS